MKHKFLTLFSFIFLPLQLSAIAVDLGPFSFRLNSDIEVASPAFAFYQDPICRAIQQQKLLVLYMKKGAETEKIVVEPYAFGYNNSGELILQGYQVEQVKLNQDENSSQSGEGYFGGVISTFKGSNWTDFSVDRVVEIRVLEDSNFAIRNDVFNDMKKDDQIVDPICQLRPF